MIPLVMSVIAKTETLQRDMAKAGKSVTKFGTTTSRTTATVMKLGRSLLMMAGVGGGLYMVSRGLRTSVKGAVDFEYQLARVSTMLNTANMKYLPEYRKEIERMSVQYGKSVEDLTDASYEILSKMIPAADAMKVLETSVRSAKGGFADVAIAVKAGVGILNSYSYSAKRLGNVTNVMHKIVNRGSLNFTDLAEELGTVTSSAAILGVDLEALGAVITTITRANVPLSQTFTGIRNIFKEFRNPSAEAIAAADEMGFALNRTSIQGAGLITIFEKLQKAKPEQIEKFMTTERGWAGFAAGLLHATDMGEDYKYMISDVQAAEENLRKEQATTQSTIDKTREAWNKAKRSFGDQTIPVLTKALKGVSAALEGAGAAMKAIAPSGVMPLSDRLQALPKDQRMSVMKAYRQQLQEAAQARMPKGYIASQNRWREDLDYLKKLTAAYERSGEVQARIQEQIAKREDIRDLSAAQYGGLSNITPEAIDAANAVELDKVKAKIASIQALDTMTRMEKIRMLDDYRMAHFGHTEEIEAAEQLLKDEILSIQQSRVDAMKVYNAELQEDMEYSALYAKEKFVDAAQEIEGSMSSAFQSMIQGGANFRDAMRQFFMDIGTSFGKMASDMMARAIMMKTMGIIMGGGGLGGDAVGAGGQAFTPSNPYGLATNPVQRHSGWVPYGTPSFQRGRGLKSNEMAAIIEKDEMLVPNKQIAKGVSGSANYEPKFNIIIVRDEKAAYLEAMNSKEGEKSYIRHASRNRNI